MGVCSVRRTIDRSIRSNVQPVGIPWRETWSRRWGAPFTPSVCDAFPASEFFNLIKDYLGFSNIHRLCLIVSHCTRWSIKCPSVRFFWPHPPFRLGFLLKLWVESGSFFRRRKRKRYIPGLPFTYLQWKLFPHFQHLKIRCLSCSKCRVSQIKSLEVL